MKIQGDRDKVWLVDVDDTLVIWGRPALENDFSFTCPYTKDLLQCKLHQPNVRLVREKLARNYFVIVWSQSGVEHAEAVVKALGLEGRVLCLGKPSAYMDDIPSAEWMGARVWLKPEMNYKNQCGSK